MVLAHEQDELYGGIFNATYAIVFLGTPHGGTDVAKLVGHVINACLHVSRSGGVAGIARIDVRDSLSNDSDALKILATSFRNRLQGLRILTFYETEITPPLAQLVSVCNLRITYIGFGKIHLIWLLQATDSRQGLSHHRYYKRRNHPIICGSLNYVPVSWRDTRIRYCFQIYQATSLEGT